MSVTVPALFERRFAQRIESISVHESSHSAPSDFNDQNSSTAMVATCTTISNITQSSENNICCTPAIENTNKTFLSVYFALLSGILLFLWIRMPVLISKALSCDSRMADGVIWKTVNRSEYTNFTDRLETLCDSGTVIFIVLAQIP